jgi:lipopolysaccharide transport system permease protein
MVTEDIKTGEKMTQAQMATHPRVTMTYKLRPTKGWVRLDFREMWSYRELLYFLTWKEVKVRYQQTVMGMAWAIMQPAFSMIVFTIFFGKIAKMPSDGIPYPLFSYTALLPWTFFTSGVSKSANSLVGEASLLKKVYLPRLFLPLSKNIACFVDFGMAFLVLVGLFIYYDVSLTTNVFWLPLFTLLAFVASLGVGLLLSALNAQFRDVKYIIPFLIQMWLFITPVVYPTSMLPDKYKLLYSLNPMVGVVDGFRWALLGVGNSPSITVLTSCVVTGIMFIVGLYYFNVMEKTFADVV